MKLYEQVQGQSLAKNENMDCAVKAVALSTGIDYDTVHTKFFKHGRISRRAAPFTITTKVLEDLGFELVSIPFSGRTMKTVTHGLPKQGNFIIHSTRHLAAFINGTVEDWSAGRGKRVKTVYNVVKAVNTLKTICKHTSIKDTVFQCADTEWDKAGRPMLVSDIRPIRKAVMDKLEATGLKRTTMSTTLGEWQKLRLEANFVKSFV